MQKILLLLLFLLLGCATDDSLDNGARPHPASYGMEGFTPPVPRPEREPKKLKFYFKECSVSDSKSYYSSTSYFCDDLNN
jgi:hypothetical protein